MPPSAMIGTPARRGAPWQTFWIAVICGTPTPATMRVVQMEPGPMPTFTASAPWSTSAFAASAVAMLPPMTCTLRVALLDPRDAVEHALRVAVRGVDDEHVDARLDEALDALSCRRDADRRADAQAPEVVLARVRVLGRLEDVLDGDEALQFAVRR
jgi:hypothetical protein